MIPVKPHISYDGICPRCNGRLNAKSILWQGIHVCAVCRCSGCGRSIIGDFEIGQALATPYLVDLEQGKVYGEPRALSWFGEPLLTSLQRPDHNPDVSLTVEVLRTAREVVVLNCIDYLYGHALLKLLNCDNYLKNKSTVGLIVIVQKSLRWMVPEGVAEIWTVDIPFASSQRYFKRLDELISGESERFERIWLSRANSHPSGFDICSYTRVPRHDFSTDRFRITFVWREDRVWMDGMCGFGRATFPGLKCLGMKLQRYKICRLFDLMRKAFPLVECTVAGLGVTGGFPTWIHDVRVDAFTEKSERALCQIYAESRLVVGVHGSNMLLPSAHAGMTLDLMPNDRWGNFAQDILFHENDVRIASYRYRFLPVSISISELASLATEQISCYEPFVKQMTT